MTFASVATSISLWSQRAEPVLRASQAWEQNAVFEPTVLKTKNGYRMWYTGGWEEAATGTAFSRDGIHWTKYAGNPVVPDSQRNSVVRHGSKFWLYYSNGYGAGNDSIWLTVSSDGVHFGPSEEVLAPPSWASGLGNTSVIRDGKRWIMLFDGRVGNAWKLGIAKSEDGVDWVPSAVPLDGGLAIAPTYGAPQLVRTATGYRLWFLAGGETNGVLPTEIFYSHSSDLDTWSPPTLSVTRSEPWEVDQVADPFVVGSRMWFAGCDNPEAFCAIGTAVR